MTDNLKKFIRAAAVRSIRTVAQAAIAIIGSAAVLSDVDWKLVLSASVLAGILSVLTSVATGLPEVDDGARYWTGPGVGDHED